MTKDEIFEMAKLSLWGGNVVEGWTFHSYEQLEFFAALVASAEREVCAKMCDAFQARDVGMQPAECAGAIRTRGQE